MESRQVRELEFRLGCYLAQIADRRDEGVARAERALQAMIASDGELTRTTTSQMFGVGMIHLDRDAARAEAIFRECLAVAPRFQGEANTLCYEIRTRLYESLQRRRCLDEAEAIAREQVERARMAMGEGSYYTVKAKARLARVMTWAAALGAPENLDEAEQLAREAAVDGLRYDEKSPGGGFNAYFRAIWAQALILRGDPTSLRLADDLLERTLEARRAFPTVPWSDGLLWLAVGQLRRVQQRPAESAEALDRAAGFFADLADPGHPLVLTLADTRAMR